LNQFGSGWAWLILKDGKLQVTKTSNADTPFAHGLKPLLTVDVWEHAYYLDYQNKRVEYLENFIKNLINWEFARFFAEIKNGREKNYIIFPADNKQESKNI
jgi:superoxide dismutase, Fe-Mn family